MKDLILLALVSFLVSCQFSPVRDVASDKFGKKSVRDYFKNVSEEQRNEALSRAELFSKDYDPAKVAQIDIVSNLAEICGAGFSYNRNQVSDYNENSSYRAPVNSYQWPTVSCNYHADVEKKMGGGSTKFLCDFPDAKSKDGVVTKKIKYADSPMDPISSEVVDTTVAFNLAKLLGFHSNNYCPAIINCKNCPNSNPWRSQRASVPPSNKTVKFEWAIIEKPIEAYVITTPISGNAARGVEWEEIKLVKNDSEDERKRILIEREAWILWVHFLQHTDAYASNQRLSCLKAESDAAGKYVCKTPILYNHDYGHSFYRHMHFSKWADNPVFQSGEKNAGCKAVLTKDYLPKQSPMKGVILGAEISAEARDVLVERLSRVTDDQWITLFRIARAEEAAKVTSETWLKAVKRKISQMKSASCLPFSAGKSVLWQ